MKGKWTTALAGLACLVLWAGCGLQKFPEDRYNDVIPPEPPTGLNATGGDQTIDVSWNPSASGDLAGYRVYVGLDPNNFDDGTDVGTVTAHTVTQMADGTQLLNGMEYYVRVRAYDGFNNLSVPEDAAQVSASTIPDPPSGLIATAFLDGGTLTIGLEWTAATSSYVQGYYVYVLYDADGNGVRDPATERSQAVSTTGETLDVTTFQIGTTNYAVDYGRTYEFEVVAYDDLGRTSTPPLGAVLNTPPEPPASLSGVPGDAMVSLTWVASNTPTPPVAGYTLFVSDDNGATFDGGTDVGNVTSTLVSDYRGGTTALQNGQTYVFRVRTRDTSGQLSLPESAAQISLTPSDTPPRAPGAVRNLLLTPGNQQIAVSWTAPDPVTSGPYSQYEVSWREESASTTYDNIVFTGNTSTTFLITNLLNGILYRVRVRAVGLTTSDLGPEVSDVATPGAPNVRVSFSHPGGVYRIGPGSGNHNIPRITLRGSIDHEPQPAGTIYFTVDGSNPGPQGTDLTYAGAAPADPSSGVEMDPAHLAANPGDTEPTLYLANTGAGTAVTLDLSRFASQEVTMQNPVAGQFNAGDVIATTAVGAAANQALGRFLAYHPTDPNIIYVYPTLGNFASGDGIINQANSYTDTVSAVGALPAEGFVKIRTLYDPDGIPGNGDEGTTRSVTYFFQYADPNAYVPFGGLIHKRRHFTATRLGETNNVILLGGKRPFDTTVHANSEYFNEKVEFFFPGPNLSVNRMNHTTARLDSGELLIVGGRYRLTDDLDSDIIKNYSDITVNTVVGSFVAGESVTGGSTGAMARVYSWNAPGTLVVYEINGSFQAGETVTGTLSAATASVVSVTVAAAPMPSSIEVYNPTTGLFTNIGGVSGRILHNTTKMSEQPPNASRVLVTGGITEPGSPVYMSLAPNTGSSERIVYVAGSLDIRVGDYLRFFGDLNDGQIRSVIYRTFVTASGEWKLTLSTSLPVSLAYSSDRFDVFRPTYNSNFFFDPSTNQVSQAPSFANTYGRVLASSVLLQDGKVLVTAGYYPPSSLYVKAWDGIQRSLVLIYFDQVYSGAAAAGSNTTTIAAPSGVNFLNLGVTTGDKVEAKSGASAGEVRYVATANAATLTVTSAFSGFAAGDTYTLSSPELRYAGTSQLGSLADSSALLQDRKMLHTATLLKDGKVLICGGIVDGTVFLNANPVFRDYDPLKSADIYIPQTESTAKVGDLNVERFGHTATLLNDGRVLVCGGVDYVDSATGVYSSTASAELYDPVTKTFSRTGNMLEARWGHTATLLNDGRVLVCGGLNKYLPEIYDPERGVFVATAGTLTGDRMFGAASVVLEDGRLLVAGGQDDYFLDRTTDLVTAGPIYSSAEVRDPATSQFTLLANSMTTSRKNHTMTLLDDGRVLIAGGEGGSGANPVGLSSAEIFDPSDDSFSSTPTMAASRYGHMAVKLRPTFVYNRGLAQFDGTTTVREGTGADWAGPDGILGSADDPLRPGDRIGWTGASIPAFYEIVSLSQPGGAGTQVQMTIRSGAGFGFTIPSITGEATYEVHCPRTWTEGTATFTNGFNQVTGAATHWDNDLVHAGDLIKPKGTDHFYEIASVDAAGQLTLTEDYDGPSFTAVPYVVQTPSRVFLVGGGATAASLNSGEVFDPVSESFAQTENSLQLGRFAHSATVLENGWVLLVGGSNNFDYTAELFDPSAMRFLPLYQSGVYTTQPRNNHKALLVEPAPTTAFVVTGATGAYLVGETVTGSVSGATARVVAWNGGTSTLVVDQMTGAFDPRFPDTIAGGTSAVTAALYDVQALPARVLSVAAGAGAYLVGETVNGSASGASALVLAWDGANDKLTVAGLFGAFDASAPDTVTGATSAASRTLSAAVDQRYVLLAGGEHAHTVAEYGLVDADDDPWSDEDGDGIGTMDFRPSVSAPTGVSFASLASKMATGRVDHAMVVLPDQGSRSRVLLIGGSVGFGQGSAEILTWDPTAPASSSFGGALPLGRDEAIHAPSSKTRGNANVLSLRAHVVQVFFGD